MWSFITLTLVLYESIVGGKSSIMKSIRVKARQTGNSSKTGSTPILERTTTFLPITANYHCSHVHCPQPRKNRPTEATTYFVPASKRTHYDTNLDAHPTAPLALAGHEPIPSLHCNITLRSTFTTSSLALSASQRFQICCLAWSRIRVHLAPFFHTHATQCRVQAVCRKSVCRNRRKSDEQEKLKGPTCCGRYYKQP